MKDSESEEDLFSLGRLLTITDHVIFSRELFYPSKKLFFPILKLARVSSHGPKWGNKQRKLKWSILFC